MGRAQCLILLALIEEAVGAFERGRELLGAGARASSTASATASGIAQCDVALGHADHRAFDFAGRARARPRGAGQLPRGAEPARRGRRASASSR